MAIVKLSKSKKQVQFIDDDGNIFVTSAIWMSNLLQDKMKGGMIHLSRFPLKASPDRFKKSPLYDPKGYANREKDNDEELKTSNDSFAPKERQERQEEEQYEDKRVFM